MSTTNASGWPATVPARTWRSVLPIDSTDRGGPNVALQLLIYPVVAPDFETVSYREHAVSPTLTRADMIEYRNDYLPDAMEKGDHRAVPLRAALRGLPPAQSSSPDSIRCTTKVSCWRSDCATRRCQPSSSTSRP